MKLSKNEIQILSRRIIGQLLEKELIETDDEDSAVESLISEIIEDLSVEDRLNEEVRDLMEQHSSDVDKSGLEFHRMFKLLKARLIRERDVIL